MIPGFSPTSAQLAILASDARFVLVFGGIRSGKTMTAVLKFWNRILEDVASGKSHPLAPKSGAWRKNMRPRLNYWIVAPQFSLLGQTQQYLDVLIPQGMIEANDIHSNSIWLRHPEGGFFRITGKSAEDPSRLVSDPVDGMLIDEAARVPGIAWEGALRGRLIDTKGWMVSASSPFGSLANWNYQLAKSGSAGVQHFTLRLRDNPVVHPDELKHARATMAARFHARDVEGSWIAGTSAVYEEFDPAVHVLSEKELLLALRVTSLRSAFNRIVVGVDFGWTDPTAMLVLGQLADGSVVAVEEIYEKNLPTVSEVGPSVVGHAWELKRRWETGKGSLQYICDGADPRSIDEMSRAGLYTRGANKEILDGVRRVANALHPNTQTQRPALLILDGCKNLIRELGALTWKTDRDGEPLDGEKDPRCDDHLSDCLRYGVAELRKDEPDGIPRRLYTAQMAGVGTMMGTRRV